MKRLILIAGSVIIASSAFAQQGGCVKAPLSMSGSQVTLTSSGNKSVSDEQVYIYYSRRHARRHEKAYDLAGVTDQHISRPLLLSTDKQMSVLPETYNVSLSTPQSTVSVCPDVLLNPNATISVEKVSSFTGNYPNANGDNKVYKKVRKHEYKVAARKIRKIEKNENRIARKTDLTVEARSDRS